MRDRILVPRAENSPQADSVRLLTTVLCCFWGLSFACAYFQSLISRPDLGTAVAAALPLAAVWAALERKRWGRLALIGLSVLAIGMFLYIFSHLIISHPVWIAPAERSFMGYVRHALRLYSDSPSGAVSILVLSLLTCGWFFLPFVRAEYVTGKASVLANGQRLIAVALVILWMAAMAYTPTGLELRSQNIPLRTPRRLTQRF